MCTISQGQRPKKLDKDGKEIKDKSAAGKKGVAKRKGAEGANGTDAGVEAPAKRRRKVRCLASLASLASLVLCPRISRTHLSSF
jgi:hypothetical protein